MPLGFGAAVELRLGKIRTGQVQNFVGFALLTVLTFQSLDAFTFFTARPRALTGIVLMAANPAMRGLRCAANLRGYGFNGCPLGGVVVQVLQNHVHGTFTDFGGVGSSFSHGLIFSRVDASTKRWAVQAQHKILTRICSICYL